MATTPTEGKTTAQIEQERREAQSIANSTRKEVMRWMASNPGWISELSDSERAKFIAPFIPKEKPIDQEFEAQALSLTTALGSLPDQLEQGRQLAALNKRCQELTAENKYLKKLQEALCNQQEGLEAVIQALNEYIKEAKRFYRGLAKDYMSEAEMREVLKEIRKGW